VGIFSYFPYISPYYFPHISSFSSYFPHISSGFLSSVGVILKISSTLTPSLRTGSTAKEQEKYEGNMRKYKFKGVMKEK